MRILSDESCDLAIEPILKNLSVDLMKFIRFHLRNLEGNRDTFNIRLANLLDTIVEFGVYGSVLESLAGKLKEGIDNNMLDKVIETMELISFAISDLDDHYAHIRRNQNKRIINKEDDKQLINILSLLLIGLKSYPKEQKLSQLSLILIDKIVKLIKQFEFQKSHKMQNEFSDMLREPIKMFNELYEEMSHKDNFDQNEELQNMEF